ncbi:molybdate ABC transporter substrate-binding protein [Corynebacterium aurimucosum]
MHLAKIAIPVIAAALTVTGCASDSTEPLQVFAASSTRVLNDELASASGTPLAFNNGGSSALVQQVDEGAPADLLLTASRETMENALAQGSVETPVPLASNVMVMVVPKGNPQGLRSAADLEPSARLVLCDPSVPCGAISTRIMEANGWHLHASSLESQVADVLGKVASGEADAGWVYSTDAAASEDVEAIPLDHAEDFRNEIMGAVVASSSRNEEARALLSLLESDFDSTWEQFGFTPVN